jgi:hypothetical protein
MSGFEWIGWRGRVECGVRRRRRRRRGLVGKMERNDQGWVGHWLLSTDLFG